MLKHKLDYVGTCPACGRAVYDRHEAVWTCPFDLSPKNPYWEPVPDQFKRSEADMNKAGLYALCVEDWEGWCPTEHMPLHSTCYDKGSY
jgi:hypothetical protein